MLEKPQLFVCGTIIFRPTVDYEMSITSMDYLQKYSRLPVTSNLLRQRDEMSGIVRRNRICDDLLPNQGRESIFKLNPTITSECSETVPAKRLCGGIFEDIPMEDFTEAEVNAEIERYQDPDTASISGQIKSLLNKGKLDDLQKEMTKASETISDKLSVAKERKRYNSPVDIKQEDLIGERYPSSFTTITKPFILSFKQVRKERKEKEWISLAEQIMTEEETAPINVLTLPKILGRFPQATLNLLTEIQNSLQKGKKTPEPTVDFYKNNKIKVLFLNSMREHMLNIEASCIATIDPSPEEIAIFSPIPHLIEPVHDKIFNGPSIFVITNEPIPNSMLRSSTAVIIGHSEIYRNIYVPENKEKYDSFINLSPSSSLNYNEGIEDPANTLFSYIMKVIDQISLSNKPLPIFVEFFFHPFLIQEIRMIQEQCKNFINTIKAAQKHYSGLICIISPPTMWSNGSQLPIYLNCKILTRKTAEILTVLGFSQEIFVTNPLIGTLPFTNSTQTEITGYLVEHSFKKVPLFNQLGNFTLEAHKRGFKSIRTDLRIMRRLHMI